MPDKPKYQSVIEHILQAIVKYPADLTVESREDELGTLIEVHANQYDIPIIIGRNGNMGKSLRYIATVLGAQADKRVNLKIVAPDTRR